MQSIAQHDSVSLMWAQDVVILGTGAFALEAMEAAHRAHARSITLITRARDRCSTVPRACICLYTFFVCIR